MTGCGWRAIGDVAQDGDRVVLTAPDVGRATAQLVDWARDTGDATDRSGDPPALPRGRLPHPRDREDPMTAPALLVREVGYARRTLLRDPQSLFFTWDCRCCTC